MGKQANSLSLRSVQEQLPPMDESAACAKKLKAALFDGIKESDMSEIMAGIVKRAKEGDLRATKLLLDMVAQNSAVPRVMVGVRANAAGQNGNGTGHGPARMLPNVADGVLAIRTECATILGKEGPLTAKEISDRSDEYLEEEIEEALTGCDWFERNKGRWQITATGRREGIGS